MKEKIKILNDEISTIKERIDEIYKILDIYNINDIESINSIKEELKIYTKRLKEITDEELK